MPLADELAGKRASRANRRANAKAASAVSGRIYFVRHGETRADADDKIRGHTDTALTPAGITDATRAAKSLCALDPYEIYSSDLARAFDTAKAIAKACKIGLSATADLRTWNLGTYEGQASTPSLEDEIRDHILNERRGVPGGETFKAFRIRFLTKFKSICDEAAKKKENCIVVAHSRCLHVAEAWFKAGRPDDLSTNLSTVLAADRDHGEVIVFSAEGKTYEEFA